MNATERDSHVRKFQKELNAGIVSLVLLGTLAAAEEPRYGYEIAKQLERDGDKRVPMKQGTLYPVLRSLSAGGLLESYVEPSVSGPPRRYYRVTAEGRGALDEWKRAWQQTRNFVDSILRESRDE